MHRRKIALRSLRNLCTFIGAIALFSYFYSWTLDTRHWYVTLASAFACSLLWLGFYALELHGGGVAHVSLRLARVASGWLSAHLSTKQVELPFSNAPAPREESKEGPKEEPKEAISAVTTAKEAVPAVTTEDELPSPAPTLPWLSRPHLRRPT
jgi:hypothetical protein